MDELLIREFGKALFEAERTRTPIAPITDAHPDLSVEQAYAIQERTVSLRKEDDANETVRGYKVGLTSKAMQDMLGVNEPDYGPILSRMLVATDTVVPMDELIQPRAEAEIAFVLREPLRGPGVSRSDVLRATAGVLPAIEVIDSRIEDWRVRLPDTIADLASSARVVLGSAAVQVADIDLRLVGLVLSRNGQMVATGVGAAALGHPADAAAWAANALGHLGVTLEARHVIMAGALHAAVPIARGDAFTAEFDRLGSISVRFE